MKLLTNTIAIVLLLATAEQARCESVTFANHVMPVISKAGCNLGTCHGNANGKGGFKLSLRGQDPEADYRSLAKDLSGRRVNRMNPKQSLILLKATTQVAHQGGKRFENDSQAYQILSQWIQQGATSDADETPTLTKLEVTPMKKVLVEPVNEVSISVHAVFSDGSKRDVTTLTVYESSNTLPSVAPDGTIGFPDPGETTIMARFLDHQVPVRLAYVPERPSFQWQEPEAKHPIDRRVLAKLRQLRMTPSDLCSDTAFVRRAYLDLHGVIPSAAEARQFVHSQDSNKRLHLIEKLLSESSFADFWALKWGDLLRNEEKALDRRGVARFHRWIRQSLLENKPLDQFAYEILSARGSTYRNPAANFYRTNRTPIKRAETAAQVFLGARLQCAQCHNHPFDRWTQDDYYNWATLFARVDYKIIENRRRDSNDKNQFIGEQVVYVKSSGEVKNPGRKANATPRFLGDAESINLEADRLEALASWVTDPNNPRFARVQVNRIWFHLLGRGLVDPVDDFRDTNLPSHPALLEDLTKFFVESSFDLKKLIRHIMLSETYQRSSESNETNADDEINYGHQSVRRFTAEQLADSLSLAVGAPLEFNGYPLGLRAAQIPGVRPSRNVKAADRFLSTFGKPKRLLASEVERTDTSNMGQAFELMSGPLVSEALRTKGNRLDQLRETDLIEAIQDLYWASISRAPSAKELEALRSHVQSAADRRQALEDVFWSLLNAKEFTLRY